jgi:nascent polypeptide-associated complex subunit alpha
MMRGGNREMRRMLDKMGLEMKDLGNIEEVIIKTETKELYLLKPQVVEMKGKDSTIFQVVATDIEEKQRDVPVLKEEDIILVMQQASVTREKAAQALIDAKGDMAQAILNLTT